MGKGSILHYDLDLPLDLHVPYNNPLGVRFLVPYLHLSKTLSLDSILTGITM